MGSSKTTTNSNSTATSAPDAKYQGLAYQNYNALQNWGASYKPPEIPMPVGFNQDQLNAQQQIRDLGVGSNPFANIQSSLAPYLNYQPQQVSPNQVTASQVNPTQISAGQGISANPFTAPTLGGIPQISGIPQVTAGSVSGQGYSPTDATASLINRGDIRDIAADPSIAAQINRGDIRDIQSSFTPDQLQRYIQMMDPQYADAVINRNTADIDRSRQLAQQQIAAQAARSGAFGGSRQGVADAETNRAYGDIAARSSADLRYQGFQSALNTALADATRNQQAAALNQGVDYSTASQNAGFRQQSGLANQDANLRAAAANQGVDLQTGMTNAQMQNAIAIQNAQAANQAGAFGANAANQASLSNAQLGLQAGLANQNSGLQVGLANQGATMQGLLANQQAGLTTGLANQQNAYNTQSLNSTQALQAALANQQNATQVGLANQGVGLQAGLANQQAGLQAGIANQGAGLAGANLGLNAAGLGLQAANQGFNADQILRGNQIQNAGLLSSVGAQQQDLQNQQQQVLYQNLLQMGLSPVMINDILRQGLASVPYGATNTSNSNSTTVQSPSIMSMIGQGIGIAGSFFGLPGMGGIGGGGGAPAPQAPAVLQAPQISMGSAGYGTNALSPSLYQVPGLYQ